MGKGNPINTQKCVRGKAEWLLEIDKDEKSVIFFFTFII